MFRLTMDLRSSAQLLGIDPRSFLEYAEREQLGGLLRFDDQWMVSIFTLAHLLDTSSEELLEVIEDYALGELMDAVADDDVLEGDASWQVYQGYLKGAE
jgi:hypothetical protein